MQNLKALLKKKFLNAERIAVLGIGSELRADDAAGVLIAQNLQKKIGKSKSRFKIFIGETAPENLTGEIIKYQPTHIIIIDSVEIGKQPGEIFVFDVNDIGEGVSFSTHKLPMKVLCNYLLNSIPDCTIIIIGMQPKSIEFGKPVSKPIRKSITAIQKIIQGI